MRSSNYGSDITTDPRFPIVGDWLISPQSVSRLALSDVSVRCLAGVSAESG